MGQVTPELVLVDPELAARAREALADPPDCLAPYIRASRPAPALVHRTERVVRPLPAALAPRLRPLDDPPRTRPESTTASAAQRAVSDAHRGRRPALAVLARSGTWAVVALFVLSPLLAFLPASSSQLPTLVAPASVAATPTDTTRETRAPADLAAPSERQPDRTPKKPVAADPKLTAPRPRSAPARPERARASRPRRAAVEKRVSISWPASPDAVVYNVIFVDGDDRFDVWTKATGLEFAPVGGARAVDYQWFAYPGFRDGKAVRYGSLAAHGEVRVPKASLPRTKPPKGGQVR